MKHNQRMPALGQKGTCALHTFLSPLGQKRTIDARPLFGLELFDHLICADEYGLRHC
jgi:hypothetical protein